jgi:diadenosine tetraphosphate (Ap4A) HIT family hydrolase
MSSTLAEFDEKFRVEELLIATTDHWRWSVRPVHSTLGAGILSLKRFCPSFGELTSDEAADLGGAVSLLEQRLRETFSPDKMNYIMLMMVDAHLHFHVLPRYSASKEFGGLTWEDSGWPGPPGLGDYADRAEHASLAEIRNALAQ